MSENIEEKIKEFYEDKDVKKIKEYYASSTFMQILLSDSREISHSSFFRWLFDDKCNYDLGKKPLSFFLELLSDIDKDSKKLGFCYKHNESIIDDIVDCRNEYPIPNDEQCHIDLKIEFKINDTQYTLVLENKIYAKESEEENEKRKKIYQTEKYYDGFKNKKNMIYVFLAPQFNHNKVHAKCKEFINVSYDEFVCKVINRLRKYVDEKLSDKELNNEEFKNLIKAKFILDDYYETLFKIHPKTGKKSILYDSLESNDDLNSLIGRVRKNYNCLSTVQDNDSEICKDFLENPISRIIFPNLKKTRAAEFTFKKAKINEGETLYLAKGSQSSERYYPEKTIKVISEYKDVEYEFNGELKQSALSDAIRVLMDKEGPIRPINYLIYNVDNKDENLGKWWDKKNGK